jgi:hypothetical protein
MIVFADMEPFESGILHSILGLCSSEPSYLVYCGKVQVASATRQAVLQARDKVWRPEGSGFSEPAASKGIG